MATELTDNQKRAIQLAHLHQGVWGGRNCYDGKSYTHVEPLVLRSLHKRGLLEPHTDPDGRLYYQLTPAGSMLERHVLPDPT